MKAWIVLAIGGFLTYLTRSSFLLFGDRLTLPPALRSALAYVAPAAFAAISIPLIVGDDVGGSVTPPSAEILAAVLAGVVIWKTKNMAICLAVGMVTLWVLLWAGL